MHSTPQHPVRQAKKSAPNDADTNAHQGNAVIARKAFEDNRPESIAQRQVQSGIQNSPQVQAAAQLQAKANPATATPAQDKNKTGMPDQLKAGIEGMSGMDMSDVRVHHGSDKPAQVQAHAYAQGNDIHLGPGQEQHLPHEAWHVVQQRQGRVQPTKQLKGSVAVNDDAGLEHEADVMGAKAMQMKVDDQQQKGLEQNKSAATNGSAPVQRQKYYHEIEFEYIKKHYYSQMLGSCTETIIELYRTMRDKFGINTSEMEVGLLVWVADNHTQHAVAADHTALIVHLEEGAYVIDPTIDQFGSSFGIYCDTVENWQEEVKRTVGNLYAASDFVLHRNATPFSNSKMRNLTNKYEFDTVKKN